MAIVAPTAAGDLGERLALPDLARRLRTPLLLALALLAHHFGLWFLACRHHGMTLAVLLDHWDGGHYSNIVRQGLHGDEWAFLPLYPMLVRQLGRLTGTMAAPQLVGSLASTLLLFAFIVAVEWRAPRTRHVPGLAPRDGWGWFLLLYGPASFAFHSNHTESLFLLLSFLAFSLSAEARGGAAGVFAGLSIFARIQGLFVAGAAAWLAAGVPAAAGRRWRVFLAAGALSALFFAGLLAFEYHGSGDPLAFVTAHRAWTHAHSLAEVARTFWMGNPWQGRDGVAIGYELFFFGWVAAALFLWRRQPALGAYALVSAAVLPLQAELINGFRYEAVLFPLAFSLGDWLSERPVWLRWGCVPAIVLLNHWDTLNYARMWWAY